jgi:DNA-binding beta-propeller fold protein YncE
LSLDLAGNLYVADAGNNRIRKIDAEGIISTVAGTGESWSEQEDGPATEIALNRPQGIAAAPDGTLYVADTGNRKLRMMSVTGIMTTIAGTGGTGFTGDGGLATSAEFLGIRSVALGPDGALYVSGDSSHRVRRIH